MNERLDVGHLIELLKIENPRQVEQATDTSGNGAQVKLIRVEASTIDTFSDPIRIVEKGQRK